MTRRSFRVGILIACVLGATGILVWVVGTSSFPVAPGHATFATTVVSHVDLSTVDVRSNVRKSVGHVDIIVAQEMTATGQLRRVNLENLSIDDDALEYVLKTSKPAVIVCRKCSLTASNVQVLAKNDCVEDALFWDCKLTDQAISEMCTWRSLKHLDFFLSDGFDSIERYTKIASCLPTCEVRF